MHMCLGEPSRISTAFLLNSRDIHRPYGTIFANEIFSSGVILSECVSCSYYICCTNIAYLGCSTDFRQFEYYLNVTGLDVRPSFY